MGELSGMVGSLFVMDRDGSYVDIGPIVDIRPAVSERNEHYDPTSIDFDINMTIELSEVQKRLIKRILRISEKRRTRQIIKWMKKYAR